MQNRHKNRKQYFQEQEYTTTQFVIPFIEKIKSVHSEIKVLEIGCGEGGNIKPFLDLGCNCTGIDLNATQINNAKTYFEDHTNKSRLTLICKNIYNIKPEVKYDLIIMRDVIEHIPNQETFMNHLKSFIAPEGVVFFGFPPWQMPFGGHQQVVRNKFLSKLPYYHLLPTRCYKGILKLFGESDSMIESRIDIKKTGISIERFEKILQEESYKIDYRTFYFINPNYKVKFNLKPREQIKLISNIPYLRNFFTTAMYYIVSNETDAN
jgi:SAM-dependent methyltransferase